MAEFIHPDSLYLKNLQQRISITTWAITLVLSLRGLFVFYGMKEKSSIEQIITFITEPLVQLFRFDRIESLAIPGLSVLFATVSLLLLSQIIQIGLRMAGLRISRTRHYVYQRSLHSNNQT